MRNQRMLIVGAGGCLGQAVRTRLVDSGLPVSVSSREDGATVFVDLEAPSDSWRLPEGGGAAFLLAALTDTAACEADPTRARKLNLEAPCELARMLAARGFFVVFPSTSQVFDGSVPLPGPEDRTTPSTVYGRLKAEAEAAIMEAAHGLAAVLRISKVLDGDNGLIRRWTGNLLERRPVEAFSDMVMAPVSETAAARAMLKLAQARTAGRFHLSAARDISYFEAARIGAEALGADPSLVLPVSGAGRGLFLPAHAALGASDPAPEPEEAVRRAFELAAQTLKGKRPS